MGKQRFRKLKQDKKNKVSHETSFDFHYASSSSKIKAFITDNFMLLTPILYIVFYIVMDGREDFANHRTLGWISIFIPLIISQTLFMLKNGQTPGYKAYNLKVIDIHTKTKPSFAILVFRNTSAILSLFTLIGWALMFFRKDKKNLHDLLSATVVIRTDAKK